MLAGDITVLESGPRRRSFFAVFAARPDLDDACPIRGYPKFLSTDPFRHHPSSFDALGINQKK